MRLAMRAAIALATSPRGFTARDVANHVRTRGGLADYTSRQAAYDLKKLRGKSLVERKGTSNRYESLVGQNFLTFTSIVGQAPGARHVRDRSLQFAQVELT
jgi:repressor of nif and glnA expression